MLVILLFCVALVYLFVHGGVPQGVRARPTLEYSQREPVLYSTVGDHMCESLVVAHARLASN